MQDFKNQFPIFKNNPDMIFLDSAASAMKPQVVIDSIKNYYENDYSNIHRGTYIKSELSTKMVDDSRNAIKDFINAKSCKEIIFTKGCTDSINKIAQLLFYNDLIKTGDNIYITDVDHHSNILPWRFISKKSNANIFKIPFCTTMTIDEDKLKSMFNQNKPKIISFAYMSNVTGVVQNIKNIVNMAHNYGAIVILDCAQSIVHLKHDIQDIDCDFIAFSMHKLYGPNGVGVLYAKEEFLNKLNPIDFGGDMVKTVSVNDSVVADLPEKFEAGTINISDIIASKNAIDFVNEIGFEKIKGHDTDLIKYSVEKLKEIKDVNFVAGCFNDLRNHAGLISFYFNNISSFDIGVLLGNQNICVRTGFHCAEPLHQLYCFGHQTLRISFGIYNDKSDVDIFINKLNDAVEVLS